MSLRMLPSVEFAYATAAGVLRPLLLRHDRVRFLAQAEPGSWWDRAPDSATLQSRRS
jgi:hypothetical protein